MNIDTLTDAQIENLWRAGNDAGDGFPVGHEDDEISEITECGELLRADDDFAVYRGARGVVAVANLHGPWAVIIAA
jgi:hypothetical protein